MHADIPAILGPVPLLIFIQVQELVTTARVRIQMHPDLPFLKKMKFALTESPKMSIIDCIDWRILGHRSLRLPVIDSILASQINAASANIDQPKIHEFDITLFSGSSD